jgi:membrane protein YqaA with SNARE-associated domain
MLAHMARTPGEGRDRRSFVSSPAAPVIGFAWAFAEATLFFIVPDVWIGWVALVARRAAWAVLGFTLLGALVGGTLTYAVSAATAPATTASIVDSVPTVNPDAIERVSNEMEEHGSRSVVFGPLRMGTPYKLYARAAAVQDESLVAFLLWSIPGRLERMLPVMVLGLLAGVVLRRWVRARPRIALSLYGAIWLAVYAVYVVRIGL